MFIPCYNFIAQWQHLTDLVEGIGEENDNTLVIFIYLCAGQRVLPLGFLFTLLCRKKCDSAFLEYFTSKFQRKIRTLIESLSCSPVRVCMYLIKTTRNIAFFSRLRGDIKLKLMSNYPGLQFFGVQQNQAFKSTQSKDTSIDASFLLNLV